MEQLLQEPRKAILQNSENHGGMYRKSKKMTEIDRNRKILFKTNKQLISSKMRLPFTLCRQK